MTDPIGLPDKPPERYRGQFIGGYEAKIAGGSRGGGDYGVGDDAVAFDDAVPDFAKEGDFQKLLKGTEGLDPNDPRNGSLLRLLDLMAKSNDDGDTFEPDCSRERSALFYRRPKIVSADESLCSLHGEKSPTSSSSLSPCSTLIS